MGTQAFQIVTKQAKIRARVNLDIDELIMLAKICSQINSTTNRKVNHYPVAHVFTINTVE